MLKPYFLHSTTEQTERETKPVALVASLGVVSPSLGKESGEEPVYTPDDCVMQGRLKNSESLNDLDRLLDHLPDNKKQELSNLILSFPVLFSDTPTQTHLLEHDIEVGDAEPIRQRFYRFSQEKRTQLESEVNYMLENNIAEPSCSSWASPCVLVSKPDQTFRPCTDFRKVNNVTKPLPRIEDCGGLS